MRIENLDELRGIAALSVCLFHCCFAASFLPQDSLISAIAQFGDKGVQVFFILSGLVIPWSISSRSFDLNLVKEFLVRRFIRIQVPYAIALALTLICYILYIDPTLRISVRSILINFFYLIPYSSDIWIVNVAWTLGVEVQFYLLVAICFPLFASNKSTIRRLSLLSLVCMGLIPSPASVNPWYFFPTWAPFFGVGTLSFMLLSKKISGKEYFISFLFIACFLYFKYTNLLTLLCFLTIMFLLFSQSIKLPFILTYLGKISYSLYLIHLPIILILGQILDEFNFSKNYPSFSIIILMLSAILSSIPFYFLFEKPSLLWAKKLKQN